MGFADRISERDIESADDFAAWVQQTVGCPYPTGKDLVILRRQAKLFFKNNPQYDYRALCRAVKWAQSKKRRFAHVHQYITHGVRYAYADGALSDLFTENNAPINARIEEALKTETRREWVYRLRGAVGEVAQNHVYKEWLEDVNG